LLGIDNTERPTQEAAVEMIAGSPEQIAETFETARQEIAKLRDDKAWVENRLREDIESLRADRLELSQKVEEKDLQVVQLQKDVEAAKDSAADKAREMLRGAGHAPVADANIDPDAATGPLGHDEKTWAEYKAMKPGAERLAFAEKNRDALDRYTNSH
tara:strand:- start:2632 stop:3105 length:474 start_codon:yes stop_codon:yes gene_type:complete